jgi:Phosphoenolpyruvate synthase/pyruvate phosphate dikinase
MIYTKENYDLSKIGGKAGALAKLSNVVGNIPDWFAVGTDGADAPEISLALQAFTDDTLFAVRSSATDEDGADNSFAGQFESYLNIPKDQVYANVLKVQNSVNSERVEIYKKERGIKSISAPAVLIQKMVKADCAGVAFAANPITGNTKECVVSAVHGLGDKLVDGTANADTYIVSDNQVTSREGDILTSEQILEIAKLVKITSKHFKRYQDIEWAYENEKLYLLQSRPITSLRKFTGKNSFVNIWDNSNIAESYNGVTTPLTFSLIRLAYEHVYREMARALNVKEEKIKENEYIFTHMLGLHGGQVYYNMLSWYKLVAILPGYKTNAKFMEQMMGVKEELPAEVRKLLPAPSGGSLIGTAVKLFWHYRKNDKNVKNFFKLLNETITKIDLSEMTLGELATYHRSIESKLLKHWDAPVINDFYSMIFYGLLRKKFASDDENKFNALLCNAGDIISAEPAKRVREMAEMKVRGEDISEKIAEYLDKFGDRCINELKLESETLNDNPETLYNAVESFAAKLQKGDVAEVKEIKVDIPKGLVFRFLLKNTRKTIRNRENLRFERTRVFGQVRKIAKEFGMRLASFNAIEEQNDIFYLELEEILGYIEGTATTTDLKGLIAVRKAEYAKYDGTAPDRFDTFDCVQLSARHVKETNEPAAGDTMKGLGCCPGIVRGRARVITDPKGAVILPGEILVAQRTDPGWIMLFPVASGVLVEYGSLLSHAAIVVREMGIPAVVSVKNLFANVKTGDLLELDGEKGTVTKIAE